MATLAEAGRITSQTVEQEMARLRKLWQHHALSAGLIEEASCLRHLLTPDQYRQLDLFDVLQLESVIRICRKARTLSEAGRELFAVSRTAKARPNDADRLKKYLLKFGLSWEEVSAAVSGSV